MKRSMVRPLTLAAVCALALSSCKDPKKAPGQVAPPPVPPPTVTPTPAPTPTPIPSIPRKPIDLARLYNGISVTNSFQTPISEEPASVERTQENSYQLEIKLTAKLPRPSRSLEDLAENDPKLPLVLNQMSQMVSAAGISPYFEKLYALKVKWIEDRLWRLDQLLTRHNFYDCETILEFTSPATGRKALLFVGDMDVNTDGSDGDRNYTIDGSSQYFQPQTSYRWRRTTERPNPFLGVTQKKLETLKKEYAQKGLSQERNRELKSAIEDTTRRIYDLETWSFLISEADPFIVLPGFVLRDTENAFSPQIGDYAVVIYEGKVYPAIVGDAGPSFKMGEASLRLCRQLNTKSSAYSRPVSNLKVSYLVFPGTAEPAVAPDLNKWGEKCKELLNEIGGTAPPIFTWENIVPPWPTPTPTPTPSPTPSPSPEGTIVPTATATTAPAESPPSAPSAIISPTSSSTIP